MFSATPATRSRRNELKPGTERKTPPGEPSRVEAKADVRANAGSRAELKRADCARKKDRAIRYRSNGRRNQCQMAKPYILMFGFLTIPKSREVISHLECWERM
jgi:hypothetical protein